MLFEVVDFDLEESVLVPEIVKLAGVLGLLVVHWHVDFVLTLLVVANVVAGTNLLLAAHAVVELLS